MYERPESDSLKIHCVSFPTDIILLRQMSPLVCIECAVNYGNRTFANYILPSKISCILDGSGSSANSFSSIIVRKLNMRRIVDENTQSHL